MSSARTRIERTFDPDVVRRPKAEADHDLVTTSVVGGGRRFFPDGVRLDLELVEEPAFESGLIYARYRTARR